MSDTYSSLHVGWNYPTATRFGPGRISEIGESCKAAGMTNPLLVVDPFLRTLPMVQQVLSHLDGAGLKSDVFSDIQGNPVEQNVTDGLKVLRDGGHDGVIVMGGGSAMDAGKVIAFMAGQTRPMWDFEDREDWWSRADPDGILPIIAVPTTSGTGSEMGRAGVIIDERNHTKKVIFHPKMLPVEVLADPELTLALPAHITAATGMDALSHNMEAYCSLMYHPMAQGIALEGMRLCKDWLPTAVKDGSNIEARSHMLSASAMGSTAFQKGLGSMHAMSHPCSSIAHTHHGLTNAVIMPYVLLHNRPVIETRMAALARYLDLPKQSFDGVMDWVLDLRKEIEIPHTLKEIGIEADLIPQMAPMALEDPCNGGNPVEMTVADYEMLYKKAIEGDLS